MPDPFISLQDLSDYLGRDVTADAGALIVTDAACDMVRTLCEQDFNLATTTTSFDGTGTDALPLTQRPVAAAGTVTVNGGTVTDYMLNGDGILLRGTAGADPRPVWPRGRQNVTVTYDHGYGTADLPRDVRMLALAIAHRLIVQGAASEEQVGDVRIKYAGAATELSTTEQIIVSKYRQIRTP